MCTYIENRPLEVKKNSVTLAQFTYDGEGKRVKSVMGSETILFIGAYYEVRNPGSGQQVTKYYFAGASRIAMRKYTIPSSMAVEYFLTDHLGSTTLTTDANGAKISEMRYKPCPLRYASGMLREGEIRYSWTSNPSTRMPITITQRSAHPQASYFGDISVYIPTPLITNALNIGTKINTSK